MTRRPPRQRTGQSLTAMEVHGHFSASGSLTVVLYDRDRQRLDRSVAECARPSPRTTAPSTTRRTTS